MPREVSVGPGATHILEQVPSGACEEKGGIQVSAAHVSKGGLRKKSVELRTSSQKGKEASRASSITKVKEEKGDP